VDWVYPDDGAFAYMRWRVPPAMYLALAEGSSEMLSAPERLAFLGNASGLLDAGVITGGDLLGVLRAFGHDNEPEVVSGVVSGMYVIAEKLVPPEADDLFAGFLRESLEPAVDRFGLELKQGEAEAVSLFRPRLFTLLGDNGRDGEVRERARTLAADYLGDTTTVDPSIASSALRVAAIEGDQAMFETFRDRYVGAESPVEQGNFLGAIGYFDDSEIQVSALEFNLSGAVPPTDLFTIPGGIRRTEAGGDVVWKWFSSSWDEVAPQLPEMILARMPYFGGGCSEDRLAEAEEFFGNPAHQVDGTLNYLTKVTESVTDCARLRRREGPSVLRFLNEEPEIVQPERQG